MIKIQIMTKFRAQKDVVFFIKNKVRSIQKSKINLDYKVKAQIKIFNLKENLKNKKTNL